MTKNDFVVIDCPPALNMLTVNGFAAADAVIIPMQCEYYALEGLSDPVRCPITNDQVNDCVTQFVNIQGGNTALKPEKSLSFSGGVALEPTRSLSITADYYRINIDDRIVLSGRFESDDPDIGAILQAAASGALVSMAVNDLGVPAVSFTRVESIGL